METSDVFLGAYLSSYSPGNADSANVFKTSEEIKLDLREMIDVSIKEISDYFLLFLPTIQDFPIFVR